jgi:hypothetical protein
MSRIFGSGIVSKRAFLPLGRRLRTLYVYCQRGKKSSGIYDLRFHFGAYPSTTVSVRRKSDPNLRLYNYLRYRQFNLELLLKPYFYSSLFSGHTFMDMFTCNLTEWLQSRSNVDSTAFPWMLPDSYAKVLRLKMVGGGMVIRFPLLGRPLLSFLSLFSSTSAVTALSSTNTTSPSWKMQRKLAVYCLLLLRKTKHVIYISHVFA